MLPANRSRRLLPLFVATALALLALDTAGFGPIAGLRRSVLTVAQPIGVVLAFAVAPVSGTWNGAVHYDELADENNRLRRRVAELEGSIDGRADVDAELRALMAATDIDYLGDVERVAVKVVADRRTDLERIVEIDKGRDAGITRGMPVVTGTGLVGTVEVVTGNRATIRLITDVEVAVGVRSHHGLGLAVGSRDGTLRLEVTPELAESIRRGAVVEGERFVTSGVDRSVYPAGIPVGTISVAAGPSVGLGGPNGEVAIETGAGDPSGPIRGSGGSVYDAPEFDVTLQPLAEIDRLGYLTVLLVDPPA